MTPLNRWGRRILEGAGRRAADYLEQAKAFERVGALDKRDDMLRRAALACGEAERQVRRRAGGER